jgi:transposase
MPMVPVKLNVAFDTKKKRFCAAKIRVLPAHDLKDARCLLKLGNPQIAVADKGYNSEALYEYASDRNILLMIPKKSNAKRGFYRKKMHKKYRTKTYNRRQLVESGFGAVKRKFGASVSSKTARTIRTEVYSRLACHNIFSMILRLLGQSPSEGNI